MWVLALGLVLGAGPLRQLEFQVPALPTGPSPAPANGGRDARPPRPLPVRRPPKILQPGDLPASRTPVPARVPQAAAKVASLT